MTHLEKMLASGRYHGVERADLMLRLAELYMDEYRALHLEEMAAEIEAHDARFEAGSEPAPTGG